MRKILTLVFGCIYMSAFSQNLQTIGSAVANSDLTNINATILNAGDMFSNSVNPGFEVPKGSGKHTVSAAALWLGGLDPQQNLYLSSQTYRQFGEIGYWPGPIGTTLNQAHTSKYDKIWKISKAQIQHHIANFNSPGYSMPDAIATWPGNGNVINGEAPQLAPYIDTNNDGIYSPASGDYPAIRGDQALYQILNDIGNVKMPSSAMMRAEIHIMNYGFDNPANTAINNTIFTEYRIINRGQYYLSDFYAGIWADFGLGNSVDDYVGCDTLTNRFFVYNSDNDDEGPTGYGLAPPVQSVMFLDKPMSHFLSYENLPHPTYGFPATNLAPNYYNYLRSIWRDNKLVTYGGNGTDQTKPRTRYMFPGNPITQTGWSERNTLLGTTPVSNTPGDRRCVGSIGPINLGQGQELSFTVAFTFSRGTSNLNSITVAKQDAQTIQNYFNLNILAANKILSGEIKLDIFPNPANEWVTLQLPNTFKNKPATVSITDNVGREILQQQLINETSRTLNIAYLPTGIYRVSVKSVKKTASTKFVKL